MAESLKWDLILRWLDDALPSILRMAPWAFRRQLDGDCRQEAELLLWRMQARLVALPEGEWRAYAHQSVRHRVLKLLRREYFAAAAADVRDASKSLNAGEAPRTQRDEAAALCDALHLEQQTGDADLLLAVESLPAADRLLLDLRFRAALSGPDIARVLGRTPEYVRDRLRRSLARLRNRLLAEKARNK